MPKQYRSPCPVASILDILGDKWTLLVVRDLFMGKHTYSEFQHSPEGMSTNILADRLKCLENEGIISKQPYQQNPLRYRYALTNKGQDLVEVMRAMVKWSNKHIPGTYTPEQIKRHKKDYAEKSK